MSDDEDQAGSKTPVWNKNPEPAKKDASAPAMEFNIDTTKSFFDSNAAATKEKESPKKSVIPPVPKPMGGGLKIRPLANMLEVKKEVVEPVQVNSILIFEF